MNFSFYMIIGRCNFRSIVVQKFVLGKYSMNRDYAQHIIHKCDEAVDE